MAEFIFTSPGIKFRERDLTTVASNVGITTLGLVGETTKGAAFEPVEIRSKNQFKQRFGLQSIERFRGNNELIYQLPYVANAYLDESDQLFVTRVLGLEGYDAGTAWALTVSSGIDPSTTGATSSVTTNTGVTFSGGSYLGVTISSVGQVGSFFSGFTKTGTTEFAGTVVTFTAQTLSSGSGTVDETRTIFSGTSYVEYDNMVVAVIRSRATVTDNVNLAPTTIFDASGLTISSNGTNTGTGNLFGELTLAAAQTSGSTVNYTVSLNPNSRDYITNILGDKPKGKNTLLWVESVYPNLIKKLDAEGYSFGINTTLVDADSSSFTDYKAQYQTPETPWIVSELRGSEVERLFQFKSISDGNSANKEIKISIANINPITREFDVLIRDFNDKDNDVIVLESFTRCTMNPADNNFVGKRIGTFNGDYSLNSEYIILILNEDAEITSIPCGFEGYNQKNWATSATTSANAGIAPKIFYKTSFSSTDVLANNYLGISENGYDTANTEGVNIDQNYFNYLGKAGFVKTKGFHLDSGATGTYTDGNTIIGQFEVGAGRLRTQSDILANTTYEKVGSRKFTVVPAGGFDGWNEHRTTRSYGDSFKQGGIYDGVADGVTPSTDYIAWETAINTFSNPEDITINLFGTPGINWSDNLSLTNYVIDVIEKKRADSLYVIDSPDIDIPLQIGQNADLVVSEDMVDLLRLTNIDSSYSATYFPHIQIADTQNNRNVYLPPTGEVFKAMAFTNATASPWYAPAGLTRGVTDAKKAKYNLSLPARDILYAGRINPLVYYRNTGVAIFGQKTLQVKESDLDRINVRTLLLRIKVLISNIAIRLVFEQNDQVTIDEFIEKATPLLDTIRRERGIEAFEIIMDADAPENQDRNKLFGDIKIKPIDALEFIGLTFSITPSGASFDDI